MDSGNYFGKFVHPACLSIFLFMYLIRSVGFNSARLLDHASLIDIRVTYSKRMKIYLEMPKICKIKGTLLRKITQFS